MSTLTSAEQINFLHPGTTLLLHNARVDMFQQRMRLIVDRWGLIEVSGTPLDGAVNLDHNMSTELYELVAQDL